MTYLEWQKVGQGVEYTELSNVRILSWKTKASSIWQESKTLSSTHQWGRKKVTEIPTL
jgi:hypothetical protein